MMNNIVINSIIETLKTLLKLTKDLNEKDFELSLKVAIKCVNSHNRLISEIDRLTCVNKELIKIVNTPKNFY